MSDKKKVLKINNAIEEARIKEDWIAVDLLYAELRKIKKSDAEMLRGQACAVANNGDLARAATMLRRSFRLSPADTAAKLNLGKIYQTQNYSF